MAEDGPELTDLLVENATQAEKDAISALVMGGDVPSTEQNSQKVSPSKTSIAIQANDYDIERKSGILPARRRIIPYKFRDFRDIDNIKQESESDEDYEPDSGSPRRAKRTVTKSASSTSKGKRGRPRKYPRVSDGNEEAKEDVDDDDVTDTARAVFGRRKKGGRGRPAKSGKGFKCDKCNKVFTQRGNLKAHQITHTDDKPFSCDHEGCGKNFRTKESLRRHKLTHLGIKLFTCDVCEKKFSSNVCLQEHKARHDNSKPYQCKVCNKAFRQVSCYRRHLITHSSEMPFSCEYCGKRFSQAVYLRSHVRSHTGERPYVCKVCDKAFAHHSDLLRHKTVHSGEKPYQCEICGTRFSDPSSRRRHVREHQGVKPYSCQLCTEGFKRSGQLKAHLNKKHMNYEQGVSIIKAGNYNFPLTDVTDDNSGINKAALEQQKKVVKQLQQANTPIKGTAIAQAVDGNLVLTLEDNQVEGEVDPAVVEETQRILQQIQTQLDPPVGLLQGGEQQLQLSYHIIHDDENQQIVEIQYHNIGEESTNDPKTNIEELPNDVGAVDKNTAMDVSSQNIAINGGETIETITSKPQGENQEITKVGLEEIDKTSTSAVGDVSMPYTILHSEPQSSSPQKITSAQAAPQEPKDVHLTTTDHLDSVTEPSKLQQALQECGIQPPMSQSQVLDPVVLLQPQDTQQQTETTVVTEIPQQQPPPPPPPQQQQQQPQDFITQTTNHSQLTAQAVVAQVETTPIDYIANPDFNSQEYYNWLSSFTELCKLVPMPLDTNLFEKISQVHKTLSDVLARPTGILTNRENFKILMTISKELNLISNEHLAFILQKLEEEEKTLV